MTLLHYVIHISYCDITDIPVRFQSNRIRAQMVITLIDNIALCIHNCECAVKFSLVGKITKTSAEVYDENFCWGVGIKESVPRQL